MICEYGCNREGIYYFKRVNKWCCSKNVSQCPYIKEIIKEKARGRSPWNKNKKNIYSQQTLKKMREAKINIYNGENNPAYGKPGYWKDKTRSYHSKIMKGKVGYWKGKKNILKRKTIKEWIKDYPLFGKIEKMRYNPDKPGEREIQVHCKNHNCKNSKEQDGWFTPTRTQFQERLRNIEISSLDNSYFYCSNKCKQECPLYNLKSDPFKENNIVYTNAEYSQFREYVLERDEFQCQYCGEEADHVHHERPQKIEPFFALDPDLAWSVCKECHYKYGHKDKCSTSNLANLICKEKYATI
ncbi:MAG TPA: hypothetical protein VMX17_03565 [Candidatus Glassbacteria bacterium]|nr:hypothetical protein [Candidatus Glassbacteria bacterium]